MKKENKDNIMVIMGFVIFMLFALWLTTESKKYAESKAETETKTEAEEPEIQFIMPKTSNEDAWELLQNRNGALVIEIVEGRVLDDEGNGESIYSDGNYYIHYDPETYHKGDEVLSIFVYNPNTNAEDDITHRVDIKK